MPRKKLDKPAPWKLVPLSAAAERLGHSVEAIRDWVERGRIASNKLPNGRVMIPESELERVYAETYRPRII